MFDQLVMIFLTIYSANIARLGYSLDN